jgi:cytidyltransferase-like protein
MGGVAGHMAHLSEDTDLTFNEIVSVLTKVASGEIKNATEKVDGQNLFLSWTVTSDGEVEIAGDGDARTARNAGDIKKGGMTTDEYISKWRGHPAENAFTNGFKAISAALRKLSPEDLDAIFANGQRYVNMEIMYPKNPNIILYSAPNVVLHGLQDFGEEETTPEMRQTTKQKFAQLVKLVDGAIENVGDENWNIHGPKLVALKKLADGSALDEVTQQIERFAAPVGMDATVGDYVRMVVEKYAEQVGIPQEVTEQLLVLMLDPDEAKDRDLSVVKLKKGLPKELQSVISKLGSKTNSRKYIASVLKPLENAISDFAIEVLRGVKSFFVDDNDQEVARMRAELERSIAYLKDLQSSGDAKAGELIDKQLSKLGKIENLASSMEGIVFEYPPGSDRIYKLTGAFAMANQLIGRARRSGMTEAEKEFMDDEHDSDPYPPPLPVMGEDPDEIDLEIEDEDDDPVIDSDFPKTIAVVPGAFKPPHKGHLDMVRKYAEISDKVIVIISKPTKNGRRLTNGREVTASDSLQIWQLLASELPDDKVEVIVSPNHASPINAAYEYVDNEGPVPVGARIILGASTKDDDWKRWIGAEKYVKEGVILLPPEETAVSPTKHSEKYISLLFIEAEKGSDLYKNMPSVKVGKDPEQFHASDFRFVLVEAAKNDVARKMLEDFVGAENVDNILSILGLEGKVDEMSTGVGMSGAPAPLASGSGRPRKKTTKRRNENIAIANEVIRLIKERGILR